MTSTSNHIDSQQCIEAASSEETATAPPLPYRPERDADEEAAKASETITRKASIPPPLTLRPILGRCLVQTPCGRLRNHLTGLAQLIDAPAPKAKGTPGRPAPNKTLPAPKYCCRKRRETLKLTLQEAWELLVNTLLDPSKQAIIESLSYQLLKQVEAENILPGYSAVVIAAGCMQFAACALETEIQFSKKKLTKEGFKVNPQAIRCAYNALWWERRRFETVLEEQGASLEALKLPMAPDGNVSRRILKADAEREWAQVEEQEMSDCGGEEVYSSMGSLGYGGSRSRLTTIECASNE